MAVGVKTETVPVDRVDIAEENVRFEDEYEQDAELMKNIRRQGVLQDIVGRWEGDRFKVILGRRRFYALRDLGMKEIRVRVADLQGYEAVSASLSENIVKRDIDPVLRAKAIRRLVEMNPRGLAGVSRDLGIPKSSLSQWTKILELDPSLLEHVRRGNVTYTNALKIAQANVSPGEQQMTAELLDREGPDVLKELMRETGAEKRGAPRGLLTVRFNFSPKDPNEKTYYDLIQSEGTRLGVDPGAYAKGIVVDRLKAILRERAKSR